MYYQTLNFFCFKRALNHEKWKSCTFSRGPLWTKQVGSNRLHCYGSKTFFFFLNDLNRCPGLLWERKTFFWKQKNTPSGWAWRLWGIEWAWPKATCWAKVPPRFVARPVQTAKLQKNGWTFFFFFEGFQNFKGRLRGFWCLGWFLGGFSRAWWLTLQPNCCCHFGRPTARDASCFRFWETRWN